MPRSGRIQTGEPRLDSILDSVSEAILVLNRNNQVLFQNRRFVDLWFPLGHPGQETGISDPVAIINERLSHPQRFPPEADPESGLGGSISGTLTLLDGRTVKCVGTALEVEGGVAGNVWSFQDVSEQAAARARLAAQRVFLQDVIDAAPESLVVLGLDRTVRLTNRAAREVSGIEDPVAAGVRCFEFIHGCRELCGDDEGVCPVEEVVRTGRAVVVEHQHQNRRGERSLCLVSASPLRAEDGEITGVIACIKDISERKEAEDALRKSEERFREAFERSPICLGRVDLEGRIVAANDRFCDFLGYPKGALVGKRVDEITHPDFGDLSRAQVEKMRSPGARFTLEKRYLRHGGSPVWGRTHGASIPGTGGAAGYVAIAIEDLTDRKAMEKEITRSRDRLRELASRLEMIREEERASVSRELHDEMGQKMAALTIDLAYLRDHLPEGDRAARLRLRTMLALAEDLAENVSDLSSRLRPPMLDLLGLGATIRWHVGGSLERAGLTVELDLDEEPDRLRSNVRVAAYRIVQEATTNVLRHAQAETVTVRVSYGEDSLHVEIEDDGVGFRPEETGGGMGRVGLLGMSERASRLGGEFRVDSAPQQGTRIELTLPF